MTNTTHPVTSAAAATTVTAEHCDRLPITEIEYGIAEGWEHP